MIIEGNEKEKAALAEFLKGNRPEGIRIQDEFVSKFREAYANADHCPCQNACKYHGQCKECVAIHRAHQAHVPNCLRDLINNKIREISELTEHTFVEMVKK